MDYMHVVKNLFQGKNQFRSNPLLFFYFPVGMWMIVGAICTLNKSNMTLFLQKGWF